MFPPQFRRRKHHWALPSGAAAATAAESPSLNLGPRRRLARCSITGRDRLVLFLSSYRVVSGRVLAVEQADARLPCSQAGAPVLPKEAPEVGAGLRDVQDRPVWHK